MKSSIFIFSFLFLTLSFGKTLTKTVGMVSDFAITSREVQLNQEIQKMMEIKDAEGSSAKDPVMRALVEHAVYLEAQDFLSRKSSVDEIEAVYKKALKAAKEVPALMALDATPDEIRKQVEIQVVGRDFMAMKSQMLSGIVSDADALAYYQQNAKKFGGLPFSQFQDNIKSFLSQKQRSEKMADWIEILKRKYRLRVIQK